LLPRILVPIAFAFALAACADGALRSADCGNVNARLAELGIAAGDVQSVQQQVERGEEGSVLHRNAWVRLNSCDGYVVVRLDSSCGPSGSNPFTTGNCSLPQPRGP
jgi:hypothetical protein